MDTLATFNNVFQGDAYGAWKGYGVLAWMSFTLYSYKFYRM